MAEKKKKKSWKKNLAKAAVGLGLGYAAFKGLGKGRKAKSIAGMDDAGKGVRWFNHPLDKIPRSDLTTVAPDFSLPGSKHGGRISKKGGGRTGKQFGGGLNRRVARPVGGIGAPVRPMAYKKGGKVKSMGVAKRGGGVAKK
jgi:hypothetical protein